MRVLVLLVAALVASLTPAEAQHARGYLTSMSTAAMLCATDDGFEVGHCPQIASRLRIYVVTRDGTQSDVELQLAASGQCLGTRGEPAPLARIFTVPCGDRLWRFDLERYQLSFGGFCLEPHVAEPGRNAPALLVDCAVPGGPAERRQEWAVALDP